MQSDNDIYYGYSRQVQQIIDRRNFKNGLMYKVKWKKLSVLQSTWEPLRNLVSSIDAVKQYEKRIKQNKSYYEDQHYKITDIPDPNVPDPKLNQKRENQGRNHLKSTLFHTKCEDTNLITFKANNPKINITFKQEKQYSKNKQNNLIWLDSNHGKLQVIISDENTQPKFNWQIDQEQSSVQFICSKNKIKMGQGNHSNEKNQKIQNDEKIKISSDILEKGFWDLYNQQPKYEKPEIVTKIEKLRNLKEQTMKIAKKPLKFYESAKRLMNKPIAIKSNLDFDQLYQKQTMMINLGNLNPHLFDSPEQLKFQQSKTQSRKLKIVNIFCNNDQFWQMRQIVGCKQKIQIKQIFKFNNIWLALILKNQVADIVLASELYQIKPITVLSYLEDIVQD